MNTPAPDAAATDPVAALPITTQAGQLANQRGCFAVQAVRSVPGWDYRSVISYKCESCPYGASDLADLHEHWRLAGHAGNSGAAEARSARNKLIKVAVMAAIGGGVLIAGAAGVLRKVELRSLMSKIRNLESINSWQGARIADLLEETKVLKSASGAGRTLRGFGR